MSRNCNACEKPMFDGFCIENGLEYYCSEECLHTEISEEEYLELYNDGEGDSYWTQWEYFVCESCDKDAGEGFFVHGDAYCTNPECLPETGARVYWHAPTFEEPFEVIILPKVRWKETFKAASDDHKLYNGRRFTVLKDITDEPLRDPEYGYVRLYKIRFDDGTETDALEEEVEDFTMALQEYKVTFEAEHIKAETIIKHENHPPLSHKDITDEAVGVLYEAKIGLDYHAVTIDTLEKSTYPLETVQ